MAATSVISPVLGTNEDIQAGGIEIDNEAINLTSAELYQVTVDNRAGAHETAVITTRLSKTKLERYVNKIVTFWYGPSARRNRFYGYVTVIAPNRNYQKDTVVDITCLGVTWPMQTGSPRWFTNKSATEAAVEVMSNYPLGFIGDTSSYQWPTLAQTGDSDWEFLNELADRVGYSVYSYNGVVRFVNPVNIINSTTPVRALVKGDDVYDKTRALLDFTPTFESLSLRQNILPSFGFFSGRTPEAKAMLSDEPGPSYRFFSGSVAADKRMADQYQRAWKRKTDFWQQAATARIVGDATLVPGVLVSVQLSRSTVIGNENDGPWLVHGVTHSITHNSFQTELTVLRDGVLRQSNTDFGGVMNNNPKLKVQQRKRPDGELRWESDQKQPILLAEFYGAPIPVRMP